jgi:hypothetical protein
MIFGIGRSKFWIICIIGRDYWVRVYGITSIACIVGCNRFPPFFLALWAVTPMLPRVFKLSLLHEVVVRRRTS